MWERACEVRGRKETLALDVGTPLQRKWIREVTEVCSTNRRFWQTKALSNISETFHRAPSLCIHVSNQMSKQAECQLAYEPQCSQGSRCSPSWHLLTHWEGPQLYRSFSPNGKNMIVWPFRSWRLPLASCLKKQRLFSIQKPTWCCKLSNKRLRDVCWPQLPSSKPNRGFQWASDVNDSSACTLPIMLSSFCCTNSHAITTDIFNVTLSGGKLLHLFFIPI